MAAPTDIPNLAYKGQGGWTNPKIRNAIIPATAGCGEGRTGSGLPASTSFNSGELGTLAHATEAVEYDSSVAQEDKSGELMMQSVFVPARNMFDMIWNPKQWRIYFDATINGRRHNVDYTLYAGQTRNIVYNYDSGTGTVVLDSDTTTPTTPVSRWELLFGEEGIGSTGTYWTYLTYDYCQDETGNDDDPPADNEQFSAAWRFSHRDVVHGELNTSKQVTPFTNAASGEWGWEVMVDGHLSMEYDGDSCELTIGEQGQSTGTADQNAANFGEINADTGWTEDRFVTFDSGRDSYTGAWLYGKQDTTNGNFSNVTIRAVIEDRW